jgi:hypothetical protein
MRGSELLLRKLDHQAPIFGGKHEETKSLASQLSAPDAKVELDIAGE